MQRKSHFTRLRVSVLICLLGYVILSYGILNSIAIEKQTEAENLTPRVKYKDTFTKLRGMYPNPILGQDLKNIKLLVNSDVYLDFLHREYPIDKPFKNLDEFIEVTPPSADKFESILKNVFENPTEADLINIYRLTLTYRRINVMMLRARKTRNFQDMKTAIHQKARALSTEPIQTWWQARFSGMDRAEKKRFLVLLETFVLETEIADTLMIQEKFEEHGPDDGLLWIAIENPILVGEILNNFESANVFLEWVEKKSTQATQ